MNPPAATQISPELHSLAHPIADAVSKTEGIHKEKGSFQKSSFSRDSGDPPDSGKQRRFQPVSRDSREFGNFRDSRVENAPTCYRAPKWPDPEFP